MHSLSYCMDSETSSIQSRCTRFSSIALRISTSILTCGAILQGFHRAVIFSLPVFGGTVFNEKIEKLSKIRFPCSRKIQKLIALRQANFHVSFTSPQHEQLLLVRILKFWEKCESYRVLMFASTCVLQFSSHQKLLKAKMLVGDVQSNISFV